MAASTNQGGLDVRTIIRISSVSRDIRSMLLDSGVAWSDLSLTQPKLLELMLQRCKAAPLYIRLSISERDMCAQASGTIALRVDHILRLKQGQVHTLQLETDSISSARLALQSLHSGTSTGLKSLQLLSQKTDQAPVYHVDGVHLGGLMALEKLTIESARLAGGAGALMRNHCNYLAELELRHIEGLSLCDVTRALHAASRTLTKFKLELKSFAVGSSEFEAMESPILMPRLGEISVKGFVASSHSSLSPDSLLQHVVCNPTATLVVCFTYGRERSTSDAICTHLRRRQLTCGSLMLSYSGSTPTQDGVRIRGWSAKSMPSFIYANQPQLPLFDISVRFKDIPIHANNMDTLFEYIKAANADDVQFVAAAPMSWKTPWVRLLGHLSAVSSLSLYGPTVLLNLWSACSHMGKDLVRSPYSFRQFDDTLLANVRTVAVYGLNLNPHLQSEPPTHFIYSVAGATWPEYVFNGARQMDQHELLMCLLCALPHKLDQLYVCYCDARPMDISILRFLVEKGNVVWDTS